MLSLKCDCISKLKSCHISTPEHEGSTFMYLLNYMTPMCLYEVGERKVRILYRAHFCGVDDTAIDSSRALHKGHKISTCTSYA